MSWKEWLFTEAGAAYVAIAFGLIGSIVTLFVQKFLTRKKPSIVQVEKSYEGTLISIDAEVKNKLRISYEDHPIEALHQAMFTISNIGEEPLEDIELYFFFEGLTQDDFLEVVMVNPREMQKLPARPLGSEFEYFGLTLGFLNPRKGYEDYVGVTFYAPKPLTIKSITGGGFGWSTKYVDKAASMNKAMETFINSTSPVANLILRVVRFL